jgi:hypothetical protein
LPSFELLFLRNYPLGSSLSRLLGEPCIGTEFAHSPCWVGDLVSENETAAGETR